MADDFKKLIKSAKKGDRHSFAVLYSGIYKDLYRYALFTLRNAEDAEDCVSDAVIDAFRTIGNLKNEESFKTWFFRILSAKCKRKIREYYMTPHEEFVYSDTTNDIDIGIDLKNAFFSLSYEDRMIISLSLFGGYKSKEIAKILRMNSNTVRSRYSRALNKMKLMIEDQEVYDE